MIKQTILLFGITALLVSPALGVTKKTSTTKKTASAKVSHATTDESLDASGYAPGYSQQAASNAYAAQYYGTNYNQRADANGYTYYYPQQSQRYSNAYSQQQQPQAYSNSNYYYGQQSQSSAYQQTSGAPGISAIYTLRSCPHCMELESRLQQSGVQMSATETSQRYYGAFPTVVYTDGATDHGDRIYNGSVKLPASVRIIETN